MNNTSQLSALVLVGVSFISGVNAAPKSKLKMNGKVASTRVQTIGGIAYVPVVDVANAMGQKVVPMAGGLEIKTPSGTYQAGKLSGKIGDIIQTKKYSFQVLSVQFTNSYSSKFLKSPQIYEPDGPEDTLFIINCRLKNTLSKPQGPILGVSYAGNTAIADYDGQSFPPKYFDSRIVGDFSAASMLPGSKSNFAVVFSIPKNTKIKDLVFSVTDYFDSYFKGIDVRIALK